MDDPLLGETMGIFDLRTLTDGEASFIRWAGLFLSIPASVNDKGGGFRVNSETPIGISAA